MPGNNFQYLCVGGGERVCKRKCSRHVCTVVLLNNLPQSGLASSPLLNKQLKETNQKLKAEKKSPDIYSVWSHWGGEGDSANPSEVLKWEQSLSSQPRMRTVSGCSE